MENLISIIEKDNLHFFVLKESQDQILIGMLTSSVDTDEMLRCDYSLGLDYLFIELLGSPHYSLQR